MALETTHSLHPGILDFSDMNSWQTNDLTIGTVIEGIRTPGDFHVLATGIGIVMLQEYVPDLSTAEIQERMRHFWGIGNIHKTISGNLPLSPATSLRAQVIAPQKSHLNGHLVSADTLKTIAAIHTTGSEDTAEHVVLPFTVILEKNQSKRSPILGAVRPQLIIRPRVARHSGSVSLGRYLDREPPKRTQRYLESRQLLQHLF
jgi:hypothetical protein